MFEFRGEGKGANCLRTVSRQLFQPIAGVLFPDSIFPKIIQSECELFRLKIHFWLEVRWLHCIINTGAFSCDKFSVTTFSFLTRCLRNFGKNNRSHSVIMRNISADFIDGKYFLRNQRLKRPYCSKKIIDVNKQRYWTVLSELRYQVAYNPNNFSGIESNVQQEKPLRMHCNSSKCMQQEFESQLPRDILKMSRNNSFDVRTRFGAIYRIQCF